MLENFVKYIKQEWKNKPDTSTPLSADRLNHIEGGEKPILRQLTKLLLALLITVPMKQNAVHGKEKRYTEES